jgi:hypothetical protein
MLEYIRKHVTQWPEGENCVWLGDDGEIRFAPFAHHDFYPEDTFEGVFDYDGTYTREQWETDLTTLDKPFGELDRATQLKLVEHVLDGGKVERCDPLLHHPLWVYQVGAHKSELLCFVNRLKYRAITI